MDDDRPKSPSRANPGEDLYGLSVDELSTRIALYRDEIKRLETELSKKTAERAAADAIFGKRS